MMRPNAVTMKPAPLGKNTDVKAAGNDSTIIPGAAIFTDEYNI